MFDFSDKVIVVTGAAGNLGEAVTEAFLKTGGTVCALDHKLGRLETAFSKDQEKLHIYEGVDSTDREGMLAVGQRIENEVGLVAVLVNTVGGFIMGDRVDQLSPETWQRMIDINVISLLNASAAFIPAMLEAGQGNIITFGAGASLKGDAKAGAYAAAKAAVLRLTESMAAELKPESIQVNCVLPGTIDTPENRQAMPNAEFTKWVKPEQIAQVILFLSSPAAATITGAAIPVQG
jgi:NAD(P)-dependent dehydrogenase (short-subunit alcohol dehydrogenase family)